MAMFDSVFAFMRLVTTSIDATTKAVLANLDTGQDTKDPDNFGEFAIGQEMYSALGVVSRSKPPGKMKDGRTIVHAETISVRKGDGMAPIGYRDLRLNELYQPPEAGVALVGYGGAYDANEPTFDGAGNPVSSVRKIYVPYAFVGGVATKAHVITVDGGGETITIVHGDGTSVTLQGGKVVLGATGGAQPIALGTALLDYLSRLESDIGDALTAIGAGPAASGAAGKTAFTGTAADRLSLKNEIPATKASAV